MSYDFIVIGAGSAGCVVAHRLVRTYGASVLLLEAGRSHRRPLVDIPAGAFKMMFGNGDYLERYSSPPQPSLGGRSVDMAQGNLVGGGRTNDRSFPADSTASRSPTAIASWTPPAAMLRLASHSGERQSGAPNSTFRCARPSLRRRSSTRQLDTFSVMSLATSRICSTIGLSKCMAVTVPSSEGVIGVSE
jgi:GMC oxidoreductase